MFNNVPRQDALTRKHNSFHPSLLRFPGNIESFDIVTEPIDAVYPGNQIFSHYGESWFEDRGMNEVVANTMSNSNNIVHVTDLHNINGLIPGCPTQLVTLANNRLVAARRIFKGQVIEVARALLVPVTQALIESGPLASIAWYSKNYVSRRQHSCDVSVSSGGSSGSCSHPHSATTESDSASMNPYFVPEHSSTSDYAVILLGSGALYGALKSSHNDSEKPANVRYKWWSVDMIDPSAVDLDELILTEPLESFDASLEQATSSEVVCSTKMLMSFTALQTIEAGEELVVDIEEIVVDGVVYKTMNDVVSSSCV